MYERLLYEATTTPPWVVYQFEVMACIDLPRGPLSACGLDLRLRKEGAQNILPLRRGGL
ncbi:MAG TPA: hypothetical protein VGR15_07480 [Bacteroidota bacterium]|nr:hypothetical protein [Bacteroidota bacterium]